VGNGQDDADHPAGNRDDADRGVVAVEHAVLSPCSSTRTRPARTTHGCAGRDARSLLVQPLEPKLEGERGATPAPVGAGRREVATSHWVDAGLASLFSPLGAGVAAAPLVPPRIGLGDAADHERRALAFVLLCLARKPGGKRGCRMKLLPSDRTEEAPL
jgi:hypothetical protein